MNNNKKPLVKKLILYSAGLVFLLSMINLFSVPFLDSRNNQNKEGKIIKIKSKIQSEPTDNNFKELKRQAMDSLINNNILTPENIKKVDQQFPDSLCHC